MKAAMVLLAVAAAGCLWGCNDFLAERMVAPPNGPFRGKPAAIAMTRAAEGAETRMELSVGPPTADLAFWVVEPQHGTAVRGTVLCLHGFLSNHSQLEGAAHNLCAAGYRAVLVDLRGHGESTGDHITFGVQDARDLALLTDYLQKRGLCGPTVGVFGTSYGAATALLFAGADPRVTTVVAVAPFDTLKNEAPHFGHYLLPIPGAFMSPADYDYVVKKMGQDGGFDPEACSPLAALEKTRAHVRLFHGTADAIIPHECSERLHEAAPDRTELTLVEGIGHLALTFDALGTLYKPTREWFDRYLVKEVRVESEARMEKSGE